MSEICWGVFFRECHINGVELFTGELQSHSNSDLMQLAFVKEIIENYCRKNSINIETFSVCISSVNLNTQFLKLKSSLGKQKVSATGAGRFRECVNMFFLYRLCMS